MTSTVRDRRTFLRRAAIVGSVAATGGFGGCLDDVPAVDHTDTDGDDAPSTVAGLRSGTEIGVGFTGLGGFAVPTAVDPDEPGGGRLVTVDAVEPGETVTISWRQTVERERTPEEPVTAGVGEETPTPEVEIVEETGTVTAGGLADAHATFLPMFWEPGETRPTPPRYGSRGRRSRS